MNHTLPQVTKLEVYLPHQLSRVQIHAERDIGLMHQKNNGIFDSIMPINFINPQGTCA